MRKLTIGVAAGLIVLAGALAVIPYVIDWRAAVAAWFRQATGRELEIAGPVAWRWLPRPQLSATDVTVAGRQPWFGAAAIVLRPSLAELLTGTVAAADVTLVDPLIRLDQTPSAWLDRAAAAPGIERIAVENGSILYRDEVSRVRIDRVDARLARIAGGAWHLDGRFGWRGGPLAVTARIDPAAAGAIPADFSLDAPASGAVLRFAGRIDPQSGRIAGKVALSLPSLAAAAQQLGPGAPRLPATPLSLSAQLAATRGAARLAALTVSLGGVRATGTATIALAPPRRFAVGLEIPLLDGPALAAFAAGVSRLRGPLLPPEWQGKIALNIGAATWHGSAIEQLAADASIAPTRLSLDRLSALLPGGSTVKARMTLALGPTPHAEGTIALTSDDCRELFGLAGIPTAHVPGDRLRRATVSTGFALRPKRLALSGLTAEIDNVRITGAAQVALGRYPEVTAGLAIDTLNLDAYLPAPGAAGGPGAALGALFGKIGLDLDARVATLIAGGFPVRQVRLTASAANGGGIASLTARSGTLPDIDLPRLEKLLAISPAGGRAAPARLAADGTTSFSALHADFAILAGVARSTDATLALSGGTAEGNIALDLTTGGLSGHGTIRLVAPKAAPAIPVSLSGTIAAPKWSYDLAPLTAAAGPRP